MVIRTEWEIAVGGAGARELPNQSESVVSAMNPENESVTVNSLNPSESDLAFIQDVHTKFNGQCQNCGQCMDKRLARYRRVDPDRPRTGDNATLVCPDCYRGRPNPALDGFLAQDAIIAKVAAAAGWDEHAAAEWLSNFARSYALVMMNSRGFRRYWSWKRDEPFRIVDVLDGQIMRVSRRSKLESLATHG